MRLEIRDLRLVAAVADVGTLTKAGQRLHLTQSALSHQLSDLESRIGGMLFERSGRTMTPTRLGELVRDRARATLAQLDELERDVENMAAGREAVLRIATECYTCYHWLPPVLDAFRELHPEVEVRIVPEETARTTQALLARRLDVCIVSSPVTDRRIVTTPLFDDELVLVVAPSHALAARRSVLPTELRGERFLMYTPPESNLAFRHVLAPAGVSPAQLSTLQLTEAILELVKANLGVTMLARWAVQPSLDVDAVRAIRVEHPRVSRTWQAAVRGGRAVPTHVTDFVELLTSMLAKPPRNRPELVVLRSLTRLGTRRRRSSSSR